MTCIRESWNQAVPQGILGSTPWNALVFLTLYAQTIGMSDANASLLVSVFLGCTAIGGFLGGWLGDLAAAKFPNFGRIAVCQFSVLIGVPLSLLLMKVQTLQPLSKTSLLAQDLCRPAVFRWNGLMNPFLNSYIPSRDIFRQQSDPQFCSCLHALDTLKV